MPTTRGTGAPAAITTSDQVVERDRLTFILTAHPVKLVNSEDFFCPPSTYRKEEQILFLLKDLIVPLLKVGFGGTDVTPEQMAQMTEILLESGPSKVAEAARILTGQDQEWVYDNLTIDVMIGLVVPFFASKWTSIRAALAPLISSAVPANAPSLQ